MKDFRVYAVSTKTNRKKAEKWARRLTADTLVDPAVHWCASPDEARRMRDGLRDSLWASLWDTSYAKEILGVNYDNKKSYQLKCYRKLLKHCFAIYVIPGHIILVDKPVNVSVVNDNLVDIAFK